MKILLIGSGGREHALVWKLAQSKKVEKIYAAPGNGGSAGEAKTENIRLAGADPASEEGQKPLLEFALREKIDLTVVGPEAPLAAGIADRFRAAGLAIVGPGKKAARLETSKAYSKSFMDKYGVRAAKSRSFTDFEAALGYAEKHFAKAEKGKSARAKGRTLAPLAANAPAREDSAALTPAAGRNSLPSAPLVIKADGLAAGKGVLIAGDFAEAEKTLRAFMKNAALGDAGKSVLLEEFIEGVEVSVLAAVSAVPGKKPVIKPFLAARDHKRRFEGGIGPNTGGMGAVAPVPDFTPALQKDFETSILAPTLKGMEAEKMDYRGFIFFGLMIQDGRCLLLEYNARLGDPETQALLPLMDSDFAELCGAIADGSLAGFSLKWKKGSVCAPVIAAEGYPASYRKGSPIALNRAGIARTGAELFIAGAERGSGGHLGSGLRTSGGRVLAVSALGRDADDARRRAYDAVRFINFEGMVFRKDIGREKEYAGSAGRDNENG